VTTLEHYAEVNPVAGAIDRASQEPVAFVPMAAVSEEGKLGDHETRPLAEVAKGYTNFARGDVLMAKITPCMENGKAALVSNLSTKLGFGSTEFHVLRARPGVDARFLFYLVWNQRFREEASKHMTGSAGQKRVPASYLKQATVPLIEPKEQRRIADILDKADAIRRKRKEAIALTEELLRSAFLDMFGDPVTNPKGWPVKALGELVEIRGGGTPSRARADFFAGNIPWATAKDFRSDVLTDTEEHVSEAALAESASKLVPRGSILIVVKSKILMRRLPVAVAGVPLCFNQDVKALILREVHDGPYLATHIRLAQRQLLGLARGVNTEGLTLAHLRGHMVMLPPVSVVRAFAALETKVRSSLTRAIAGTDAAEVLFNSLVARAFSGALESPW